MDSRGPRTGHSVCHIGVHFRPSDDGAPPDVERGVAYLLFGAAITLVCSRPRILLVGIVLAVAFAGLLEAAQNFVPTRQGSLHDFSVKALALVVGSVAMWVLRRLYRRFNR